MPDSTTWEQNAVEYGALSKQGVDVRLAALVACSVQRGTGQGKKPRNVRNEAAKTSAQAFARKAGSTAPRILRHLDAWEQTHGLPDPATLEPGDVNRIEVDESTEALFLTVTRELNKAKATGGRPRDSKPEHAADIIEIRGAEAVVEAMTDKQVQAVVTAAVRRRRAPAKAAITEVTGDPDVYGVHARLLAGDTEPIESGIPDVRETPDYQFGRAVHAVHSAVTHLEIAMRKLDPFRLDINQQESVTADRNTLSMILALAEGVPSNAEGLTP